MSDYAEATGTRLPTRIVVLVFIFRYDGNLEARGFPIRRQGRVCLPVSGAFVIVFDVWVIDAHVHGLDGVDHSHGLQDLRPCVDFC